MWYLKKHDTVEVLDPTKDSHRRFDLRVCAESCVMYLGREALGVKSRMNHHIK